MKKSTLILVSFGIIFSILGCVRNNDELIFSGLKSSYSVSENVSFKVENISTNSFFYGIAVQEKNIQSSKELPSGWKRVVKINSWIEFEPNIQDDSYVLNSFSFRKIDSKEIIEILWPSTAWIKMPKGYSFKIQEGSKYRFVLYYYSEKNGIDKKNAIYSKEFTFNRS